MPRQKRCWALGVDETGQPFCEHGPMYTSGRQEDGRQKYACPEKRRAYSVALYDSNPIYRIQKRESHNRNRRRKSLARKKEVLGGALPPEG